MLQATHEILTEEIPDSIRIYASRLPAWDEVAAGKASPVTELELLQIAHNGVSPFVRYRVAMFGQQMDFYAQLNVRRLVVIFYLPPNDSAVQEALDKGVCPGARQAGWSFIDYGVHESDFPGVAGCFRELAAFMDLPEGFLTNAEHRLFVTQDLAAMIRSVLLNWSRCNAQSSWPAPELK